MNTKILVNTYNYASWVSFREFAIAWFSPGIGQPQVTMTGKGGDLKTTYLIFFPTYGSVHKLRNSVERGGGAGPLQGGAPSRLMKTT